jgi:GNAT superfamily N-acetyltransferase
MRRIPRTSDIHVRRRQNAASSVTALTVTRDHAVVRQSGRLLDVQSGKAAPAFSSRSLWDGTSGGRQVPITILTRTHECAGAVARKQCEAVAMQVCKTCDGSPPEVGIAELRGCVELAQRLRVNLEIHGVRDSNGISRWYLRWIEATERRKGSGTAVMRELIHAADRHSREITLKAASRRGAHGIEELVAYYQRFGFKRLGGPSRVRVMMARSPQ